MSLGKLLFALLVVAVVFACTAGSAQATLSYVRPSGDGIACGTQDPKSTSCVDNSAGMLECGENGSNCPEGFYNLYEVGVTSGETVDFTFSPGTPTLQIVECGYNSSSMPGIYPSGSDTSLNLPCTDFGVGVDPTTTSFITDLTGTTGCATNMVCYKFSGPNLPSTWVFGEISTGPSLLEINGVPVATPEPASMTLLAAGLVGLGALRRKRAA